MASSYSTNLALELIGNGDQSGTWGTTTNTNLGTLIEQAISGYVTQAISDLGDTTITIPNGATGVARNMCIEGTGVLTADRNLIVPAKRKLYVIYNNTTGGYAVTVKVSGQTGVAVPNGSKMLLVCNGTDVVNAVTAFESIVNNVNFTSTGYIGLPSGTTAERGSPSQPSVRYNEDLDLFEGYDGSTWGGISGGGAGGAINTNKTTASTDFTLATGSNGFSVGPVEISTGVTITISSGQRWVVI